MHSGTDSTIYWIETKDVHANMASDVDLWFDTFNYSLDRPLPTEHNHAIPGKNKDELGGDIITRVVCLRSKLYSVESLSMQIQKFKGVQCYMIQAMSHNDYE